MADLLSTISTYVTPDMIQKAAALIGENPTATQKAMGTAVPTILSGLTNLASSDTGASQLLGLISRIGGDGNVLNDLASLFGGGASSQTAINTGREALQTIFGGRLNGIIDALAGASGLSSSSASSLLSLAVPLVLGVLGRERKTGGLDAGGLANLLRGQRSAYAGLLPGALSSLLGAAGATAAARVPTPPTASGSPLRWLVPVALLALLGAWLVSSRGCGEAARETAQTTQQRLSRLALPGGASLDVREGSFSYNLARFLGDTADTTVPRTFVFEDLNFETGSAGLTPGSKRVVDDLIVIMKAYPTAQGRLEGHTDNTGDAAANKQLSDARARSVRDAMVAGGIAAARLDAVGFGQERPIASNDTDAGRAKNRRTELVVTAK